MNSSLILPYTGGNILTHSLAWDFKNNASPHNVDSTFQFQQAPVKIERFVTQLQLKTGLTEAELSPLVKLMGFMLREKNTTIKYALKKNKGYISRLFSNERWSDWFEDKTALGKVISMLHDYMESPGNNNILKQINIEMVEEACEQAKQLLKNPDIAHNEEESYFYNKLRQIFIDFDKIFSRIFPVASAEEIPLVTIESQGSLTVEQKFLKRTDIRPEIIEKYKITFHFECNQFESIFQKLVTKKFYTEIRKCWS